MPDILNPEGGGYDPNNPGSAPFSGTTAIPPGTVDGGDFFGDLSAWLFGGGNPNQISPALSGILGAIGGFAPVLGPILAGGVTGNQSGEVNQTGSNQFTGQTTSAQQSNFNNLLNQLLSGTNFQNSVQNQQGMTQQNTSQTGGFNQAQTGGFGQQQAGGFNQAQTGGFNQAQTGGMTQAQQGGFGQQQFGGMTQNQLGGFSQAQTGGFGQQQAGGFGQQQMGGFDQATTGGMTQEAIQRLNQMMTPIMMPEAQAAGSAAAGALAGLLPEAQGLWGQGADFMRQLGPMMLQALAGGGNAIPAATPEMIRAAFEPFIGDIGDQAITAARNRGFAGGADLLGGAATPLAARALANVPGQQAQALLQYNMQIPLMNAQIQQMLMQGFQGAAGVGNSMMNPLAQAIGQQIGLVSAYPTGQALTGENTTSTTGTNFGNTTGTNYGNTTGTNYSNTSGTNFGNTTGTNFNDVSGTNFGNTTGTNFNNVSGTNFGNTSGTNFGNTSGTNFGNVSGTNFQNAAGTNYADTNSIALQNLINTLNQQGGFNQMGQTTQQGQNTQTGITNQSGQSNNTMNQTSNSQQQIPMASLIGTGLGNAAAGGLSGIINQQNANNQNNSFVNLLGQILPSIINAGVGAFA